MAQRFELPFASCIFANSQIEYKCLQRLGRGGNATTFLVIATNGDFQGVLFAAKVFTLLGKPDRRASFLDEVRFLKDCQHPSIMRVFDEGIIQDQFPFVIAEYLPDTLEKVIRADRSTISEKLSFTVQLLSALAYLAKLSPPVLHRDIKPQNVFIKGRSCVLGDFGLLKREDLTQSRRDRIAIGKSIGGGMPNKYRTPDLVKYFNGGPPPTTRSDVFQAGLVIAELFTGFNPLRHAKSLSEPCELNQLSGVPGALDVQIRNLIDKMLAMDPEQRESAENLIGLWHILLISAARRAHDLEGRVF